MLLWTTALDVVSQEAMYRSYQKGSAFVAYAWFFVTHFYRGGN